ncbi:hypothetical protein PGT21_021116 [Puccinia graminis f. sp. tritici]|uniref:Uncharacterized protein n=1 Tax=Puccinia graminis f. sp. tritici TaxID=56615 RepID=A0A5B0MV19_PUCGR|nr:hypothetical protein PGT21_022082 [Puccinia graminis f. sp. tritici]KAA1082942.1 hypothetical protein PGT21_021116 [Puccinia graminis f. sp. tritici]KAA1124125.1 hypothetical protein PGTUg99_028637 [Puccinia graminis f. sp. tritici]
MRDGINRCRQEFVTMKCLSEWGRANYLSYNHRSNAVQSISVPTSKQRVATVVESNT